MKLLGSAVVGAGAILGASAWRRHLSTLEPELGGEAMVATTDDGWQIGMRRYRVPAGVQRRGVVVAGHGFAGTSLIWDIEPSVSPARHLAAGGWEFFAVDLRGRGRSWPGGVRSDSLDWCFDDFVRHDLPTAVAAACEAAEVDHVTWMGLEMSGQALYAALIEGTVPQVSAGITIGAPVLTPPDARVPGVTAPPMARRGRRVQFRAGAHHVGPVLAALRSSQLETSFRPQLVDPIVPARYLRHGVPDESVVLADQFRDWVDNATMRSLDHEVTWSERMGEVAVPMLVMVGAADLQRPPESVRAAVEMFGSDHVLYRELGVHLGLAADHGHDDVLAARSSPFEIYPIITDWLELQRTERGGVDSGSGGVGGSGFGEAE